MNLETKQSYEANGIIVREQEYPDPHFRTRTFTTIPGSYEKPYYNAMYEIPNSLYDNDVFDMNLFALPDGYRRDCDAIIWDLSDTTMQASELGPWLIIIGLAKIILIVVGSVIILSCIYNILDLGFNPHPCGPQGSEIVINDCYKKVIFPDCSWIWFNSCGGPDENGDGIPDGIVEGEGGPPPNYMELLLYGVIAVGTVAVILTLVKHKKSEAYYGEHPSERPAPRRGYLSRKWYGE